MKICNTVLGFKEFLESALNLDDVKLREYLSNFVVDLNKAIESIICFEDSDNDNLEIEKK